jgi:hypothetical protein
MQEVVSVMVMAVGGRSAEDFLIYSVVGELIPHKR